MEFLDNLETLEEYLGRSNLSVPGFDYPLTGWVATPSSVSGIVSYYSWDDDGGRGEFWVWLARAGYGKQWSNAKLCWRIVTLEELRAACVLAGLLLPTHSYPSPPPPPSLPGDER